MPNTIGNDDVTLDFYHPLVFPNNHLVIGTGANRILWSYHLNTQRYPTYGGEVIQVLSATMGQLTISGNTKHNAQLKQIYDWFRKYISLAGTKQGNHTQIPVTLTYPERGWQLGIYVLNAQDFALGRERIATEWTIVCEVNQDDADIASMAVMNAVTTYSMAKDLISGVVPPGIVFVPNNPFSAPPPNTTGLAGQYANTIGNNFGAMIGALSAGKFTDFNFNAESTSNKLSTAEQYYQQIFGSPYVNGKGPSSGSGSTTGGTTPGTNTGSSLSSLNGTLTAEQVAAVASAGGFPDSLLSTAVTLAHQESTFNVGAANSINAVGLWQIYNGSGWGPGSTTDGGITWEQLRTDPVANAKVAYHKYQTQGWTAWTTYNTSGYFAYFPIAEQAVKNYLSDPSKYDGTSTPTGTTPSGDSTNATVMAAKILTYKQQGKYRDDSPGGSDTQQIQATAAGLSVTNAAGQSVMIEGKVMGIIVAAIEAGFAPIGTFALCSDHSADGMTGHEGGHAVDISTIRGIPVNSSSAGPNTLALGAWLKSQSGALSPRQVISGGWGNTFQSVCLANCKTDPVGLDPVTYYTQAVLNEHENHIHVGF